MIEALGISSTIPATSGRRTLLDGVDLRVESGASTAIIGRSGSGKTSLLSILGLMRRPEGGTIALDGRDMSRISESRAAAERNRLIGFVFQSYSLIPHLNVYDNVALPAQYARRSKRQIRDRVHELLDSVDIASLARSSPAALSGGEQQRVAIARALIMAPQIILADEPTGALDIETGAMVMSLLVSATRAQGASLVVVTHDRDIAKALDTQRWLLNGRLGAHPEGTGEQS